jgi:hypothetical protein
MVKTCTYKGMFKLLSSQTYVYYDSDLEKTTQVPKNFDS